MKIISIDGIRIRINPADLDGDGETGGIEELQQSVIEGGIQPIQNPTELGDTLKELNRDDIEPTSRMSGIDMRSRLHPIEVSSILAFDTLVSLRFIPTKCLSFTRNKKRLSVSLLGEGRKEIVSIVAGKRDVESNKMGFGDRIKGFFGGNKNGQDGQN